MIIKDNIANEPVLSNVGQVGEFRIRNSAKAFSILSSGLYANKIRAIIREYSCNAVDSHVEAGRTDTPFDVHLPNSLEPWFSVRDYGVGLDEQQVRNIFTTYFESTKNNTDEMIGGLGLGSKSAFSYTDNFTIVAVKNGVKRVYTAFINEQGVPSIAPMGEDSSDEPSGVEIRFAVEDMHDFRKFYEEARVVFKHFKLRPVISGGFNSNGFSEFTFLDPAYEDRDIIPGVHSNVDSRSWGRDSYAVMGNIEYPLQVPSNADLGGLDRLLSCGLTIEFAIGELDIQASREGLSYIPETIAAIKAKLEALNIVLADRVAAEAAKIKNSWEKVFFYQKKMNTTLWTAPTTKHLTDIKFELLNLSRSGSQRAGEGKTFHFSEATLAEKFNIKLSAFTLHGGYSRIVSNLSMNNVYDNATSKYDTVWAISISPHKQFVENDTTIGAITRTKHHWRTDTTTNLNDTVYVIDKADKQKDINIKAFLKAIANPPANQIHKASSLLKKERAAGMGKDVSILKLEKRDDEGRLRSDDMVWRDAGNMASFDDATTYYYMPLSGFQTLGATKDYNMKTFAKALYNSGIMTETVYGVRKADLETVQNKTNWVNIDDHVRAMLAQNNSLDVQGLAKGSINMDVFFKFSTVQGLISNANSPYLVYYNKFAKVKAVDRNVLQGFEFLCTVYDATVGIINIIAEVETHQKEFEELVKRYPLLNELSRYYSNIGAVAEYINAIDLMKK